ncbi:MSF1-domain-containing protein [Obba rivulosa]|uniref:MSF1-domain-containing protein n=1 Tax=Obba rivulosa TaxID=1052685 RepID=A0A8E2DVQ7_9APHY|nr:MSF1-domain-containing protein [Obba rivulosa]
MKFYSNSFLYDDPWSIVSLAFFLRYPNPYASHVLSCDVIARSFSESGTLLTTRLILKKGSLPRWAPKGIISRAESWIVEETEVDPHGRVLRCMTRNLDHVKVMRAEERITISEADVGKTLQYNEARFVSGFGWGLTKRIESHVLARFKANVQKSREGFFVILNLIRQSRMQHMTIGAPSSFLDSHRFTGSEVRMSVHQDTVASYSHDNNEARAVTPQPRMGPWGRLKAWLRPG